MTLPRFSGMTAAQRLSQEDGVMHPIRAGFRESPQLAREAMLASGVLRFCVDCGLAIAPDRIAAVPHAARCLECQARYETAAPAASSEPPPALS